MKKPDRARCCYCGTYVTGDYIGKNIYGWGCKDEDRCAEKSQRRAAREAMRRAPLSVGTRPRRSS